MTLLKNKKVILLGSDLRNPQIHKSFGVEKVIKGISEIIYNNRSVVILIMSKNLRI